MIEQQNNSLRFLAFFTKDGEGATGLTVTADVRDPDGTLTETAASATEIGGGLYNYTLAAENVDADGEFTAIFKTAGDVDQAHLPSLWTVGRAGIENLDEPVSTRSTPAQVTTIVGAIAGGGGSVEYTQNVTDSEENPLDGVSVIVRTGSSSALTPAATGTTDAFGNVTFMLDPGTYYVWCQRAGINFTNPTEIEVTA